MLCNPKNPSTNLETAFVIVFGRGLKSNPLGNLLTNAKTKIYIGLKNSKFCKSQVFIFDKVILLDNLNDYEKLKEVVVENMISPDSTRIAITEYEACLSAARLREELGIPGPTTADIARFIDKDIMKQIAVKGGIKIPKYAIFSKEMYFEDPVGYMNHLEELIGYSMFIKPLKDTGSSNVFNVNNRSELETVLATIGQLEHEFEIDEYLDGTCFSLQGIIIQDQLKFFSCGRYSSPSHKFDSNTPYGLITEPPESHTYRRMQEYLNTVVEAFKPWDDNNMFCQVYLTKNDEIVLIEVENRRAGSLSPEMLNYQHGFNTETIGLDLQFGSVVKLPLYVAVPSYELYGAWVTYRASNFIEGKNALPKNIKSKVFVNWLCQDGAYPSALKSSGQHSASVLLIGDNFDELEKDFQTFIEWVPYVTRNE